MQLRLFAGFDLSAQDASDLVTNGYSKGVPMGGDLYKSADKTPGFLVSAQMDPESANLDRIQIVKGWIDAQGETHEKIFNIATT